VIDHRKVGERLRKYISHMTILSTIWKTCLNNLSFTYIKMVTVFSVFYFFVLLVYIEVILSVHNNILTVTE
jgi:hypothetical protein